ncbi:MAG TPA: FAD-binding oxidoreductase [Thermomicrobiales bacterium]|nr:FAD-binding oxidoreductase [Thermomicrobiales bacterium]
MARVAVIGGGIVGASAAYHLAREGVETILIDRQDAGHATAAGAGIISPGASVTPPAPYFPLAQVAAAYYPELVAALAEVGESDSRYEVVGELILARTETEFEALPAQAARMADRRAGGMPNIGAVTPVDDRTARQMFPALGEIMGALHVAEAARVDGDFMRRALLGGAHHFGAEVRFGNATLMVEASRVTGVLLDGEQIPTDGVVVATGAWTNSLLAPLGVTVAVAPQRGQILHVTMPNQDTTRWPIIGGTGEQYMLTFGPNRVVSGATRETGSGFDVRKTVGGFKTIFDHALSVAPGLAQGTVQEIRVGLRPLSADGLPFLGPVPGYDGLVLATGHGASGLMLGPWSGLAAAQLVLGQPVAADLRAVAVDRPIA